MARFVGTGKDPRYPKGVVVDIPDSGEGRDGAVNASQLTLVDKGFIEALPREQDPGRSPDQLANAAVRGDLGPGNVNDPVEVAAAAAHGLIDDAGFATAKAYAISHEDPQPEGESLSKVAQANEAVGDLKLGSSDAADYNGGLQMYEQAEKEFDAAGGEEAEAKRLTGEAKDDGGDSPSASTGTKAASGQGSKSGGKSS
jgi:hypothetical protein